MRSSCCNFGLDRYSVLSESDFASEKCLMTEPAPQHPPFAEFRTAFLCDPLAFLNRVPGVFCIDKPTGMTSHDVVAIARKRLGMKKIGHGGTLDPLATGLLLVLAGRGARLFDALQGFTKSYCARLRWGLRTDTQDATGTTTWSASEGWTSPDAGAIEQALAAFRGEIQQVPPMYSALKKDGHKLCDLARKGQAVEREPRVVTVEELVLEEVAGEEAVLRMTVSKGFYVRTLIDDLGQALGVGATMTELRRTAIGPFTLAQATAPEAIILAKS